VITKRKQIFTGFIIVFKFFTDDTTFYCLCHCPDFGIPLMASVKNITLTECFTISKALSHVHDLISSLQEPFG
jgi:hypothetical protein